MKKFVFILLFLLVMTPVFADFITTTGYSPYYGGFNSKLRMNQPQNNIATYRNYNKINQRYRQYRKPCRKCHPYGRYNPYRYQTNNIIPSQSLNALEKYAFNKSYSRENDLQRLERLENLAFGASQYGDLESRYQNVENAILSRPQYNVKRSVLGNIANYFAGQATGVSPSLTTGVVPFGGYSNFMPSPNYNNNRIEQYSNGIFGGGWGISGNEYGSGSSIKILD